MEHIEKNKIDKKEYEIIPFFSKEDRTIEMVIENAFIKFLKFNDYE